MLLVHNFFVLLKLRSVFFSIVTVFDRYFEKNNSLLPLRLAIILITCYYLYDVSHIIYISLTFSIYLIALDMC